VRPYYIVPDGKVGHDAYAVIRETIRTMDKVAIARVVLTNREHIIALEARGKGLVGMLLRYPYEIRDENEYFDDIQDVKVTKEMLDLARHIVETKSADFEPAKFEDRYENALVELLNQKRKGEPLRTSTKPRDTGNVINLMDALRKSLDNGGNAAPATKGKPAKKSKATGQREMLMSIPGKGEGKPKSAAKETKRTSRQRKAG
jgi:DNA end-binding protein Ku